MDRRTIIAFALIAVIFLLWSFVFSPKRPEQPVQPQQAKTADTHAQAPTNTPPGAPPTANAPTTPPVPARYQQYTQSPSHMVTIETPLYTATLNSRGALLWRMEMKRYKTWYGAPVQLICDSAGFPGEMALAYTDAGGQRVSTELMGFTIDGPEKVTVGEHDSVVVVARLRITGGADTAAKPADTTRRRDTTHRRDTAVAKAGMTIEKRFVFHGDRYGIGLGISMRDSAGLLPATGTYDLSWRNGLKYQEHNSVDESAKARTIALTTEEKHELDANEVGVVKQEKAPGTLEWVGTTVKYFTAALIPEKPLAKTTTVMSGTSHGADSSGHVEVYDFSVTAPMAGPSMDQQYTLVVGPLEYEVVHSYGVTKLLDLGMALIRPIGEFVLLPLFRFLHSFIGNWGLVIIVFSLVVRLALWPLSIPQIKSSRKMQLLQPLMREMKVKYKDDQQRQQMETMKLYREYGLNPMGGCLPMVLQLPILYALWNTLSSAIDLRQAGFALWIHDLSIPDYVIHLPFEVPLLGGKLSALALIMGATLFFQQRMMITDPQQKMLVYMMPVLLTLAFNNLPSGLNLYYLTFNILAISQQVYMTKFSKNPLTLEMLRAESKNKKKGWLSSKLEEAQKMAEVQRSQGASARPAERKVDGRTPVEPRGKKK